MAAKTTGPRAPDTYFELVKEFPLKRIRDDAHLRDALRMLDRLLSEELDAGAEEYMDVLAYLIESYEAEHVGAPEATAADVLRQLLRSNGLSQSALSRQVGIAQSTISAVLASKRTLTTRQIAKLARRFNISAAAFMPATDSPSRQRTPRPRANPPGKPARKRRTPAPSGCDLGMMSIGADGDAPTPPPGSPRR